MEEVVLRLLICWCKYSKLWSEKLGFCCVSDEENYCRSILINRT
jgi:hypothetical protein